jgi:hypothetical protein
VETLIAIVGAVLSTIVAFGVWHYISRKLGWTDEDRDSTDR